jgi:hypothetical protein
VNPLSKREVSVPLARELQLIGLLKLSADTRAAAGCATLGSNDGKMGELLRE